MDFNLGANPKSLVPDSPAVKRQKTTSGYTSTSNSANNTGVYNSDADSGDDLFAGYIPDTPAKFETQPTQIIDRSVHPLSSPPKTPKTVVQVPASSPFSGRDSELAQTYHVAASRPMHNGIPPPNRQNLASSMAPAGTAYRPPHGIVGKPAPTRTYITLDDDEDDGPQFQGGSSSDDETNNRANIKPSTFAPKTAQSSFGRVPSDSISKTTNGLDKFKNIVANAAYRGPEQGKVFAGSVYDNKNRYPTVTTSSISSASKPRTSFDSMASGYGSVKKPQVQMRPERARPIEDISLNDLSDQKLRENVTRLRQIFPTVTVLVAKNALIACKGSLDDAATMLGDSKPEPTVISDDEIQSPEPMKKPELQMKRGLNAPLVSIRDKYSSTQALPPRKPAPVATPPKPKKRLVQGRRNPSSPAIPVVSSPLKPQSSPAVSANEYDSDSGVASATEEDPELEDRVLKYLNSCKASDLVELINVTKAAAETMIAARPFRNLDAARDVSNTAALRSGKKSTRAPIGDKIVETAMQMFSGYEAIDALVAECEQLGKPLAAEMTRWGFDVFGASKDGELEMTSFEDDIESQRDSGIGSPSSAAASTNGEEEIKTPSRRRGNVTFLKKPDFMAEDCVLKDYQVVGLNWLALMYRHKLSCILADEMGLGKTCQVIAFISHLVETGINGPHLVVCPGSTLENWLREIRRFAPNLVVEPYHGKIVF